MVHHDDPHPQYRFGLLPEPLTAPPFGGWKMNLPMAERPHAFPLDRMSPTDPASRRRMSLAKAI
jgi:hypothetical protein